MRHKHADLIHAWAEGAEIQLKGKHPNDSWLDIITPRFDITSEYRIKPKTVKKWQWAYKLPEFEEWKTTEHYSDLECWSGEGLPGIQAYKLLFTEIEVQE